MGNLSFFCILIMIFLSPKLTRAQSTGWVEKIKIGGDFRFRTQSVEDESGGDSRADGSRVIQRIRARLGVKSKVNNEMNIYLRLTSGTNSTTSTNQTLTDEASNKGFELDRAYLEYRVSESWDFWAGKMRNPLYRPGNNGLQFDNDLTPEGAIFNGECSCLGAGDSFFKLGVFWVDELDQTEGDGQDQDVFHYAAQLGHRFKLSEFQKLRVGFGHNFFNTKNNAFTTSFKGNSNANGRHLYDYSVNQVFLVHEWRGGHFDVESFIDYLSNSDPSENSEAYAVGFQLGSLKEKGDIVGTISWLSIEADAVFSKFNDSNFNGGNTNARGYILAAGSQFAESSIVRLYYSHGEENEGAGTDYDVAQIDFMFKF